MGIWNCRCGCENHLIRVSNMIYEPPIRGDPKMKPLSKDEALRLSIADRTARKEMANERKLERQRKRIQARLARQQKKRREKRQQNKKQK